MKVFTAVKKIHRINELKSWVLMISLSVIIYLMLTVFTSVSPGILIISIIVIFLLKLGDTFTQYWVAAIQIDKENCKLNFRLCSLMSGEKIKTYDLRQATPELKQNKLWSTGFKSSPVLRIYLPGKEIFRINSRYGFAANDLIVINDMLKSSYT